MAEPFEVHAYSIGELERLFVEKSRADAFTISTKSHKTYFESYFSHLGAQTILVENSYVDGDFLADFAEYYVRCFEQYGRFCVRLHFFDLAFSEQDFRRFLRGMKGSLDQDILALAYLGFIVVKPLPETIVGRTCLKTYPRGADGRAFPITRRYEANLFGVPLAVDTLAFQEQDSVVAACATSALWSVFQGTGKLFQHPIPSPVEITKAATILAPLDTRTLPDTHGLTIEQMAHAIRSVSLEPFPVRVNSEYVLKSTLYAYLRGRVPLLMGVKLARKVRPSVVQLTDAVVTHAPIGGHAVAVTGYNLGLPTAAPYGDTGFLLRAARIDKIYAHDDQVGPFARMAFDGERVWLHDQYSEYSLSTSWGSSNGDNEYRAVPDVVLVPLYHKIRIPFERVHDTIVPFDAFIEDLRQSFDQQDASLLPQRVEWDIYLTTINDLKQSLRLSDALASEYRLQVLLENMPRFLWRATARAGEQIVLDLLFDTTDIEQGSFFMRAIEYHQELSVALRIVSREPSLMHWLRERPDWGITQWFKNQPQP